MFVLLFPIPTALTRNFSIVLGTKEVMRNPFSHSYFQRESLYKFTIFCYSFVGFLPLLFIINRNIPIPSFCYRFKS